MHPCSAVIAHAAHCGDRRSSIAATIWEVMFSCTCRRREYPSARRVNFDRPTTRCPGRGRYAMVATPVIGRR